MGMAIMKWRLLILWLSCTAVTAAWGQSAPDTLRSADRRRAQRMIDTDGDGIPDRPVGDQRRLRNRMDTFIDANGDGICDGREGGLGFRRSQVQSGTPKSEAQGRKGQRGK